MKKLVGRDWIEERGLTMVTRRAITGTDTCIYCQQTIPRGERFRPQYVGILKAHSCLNCEQRKLGEHIREAVKYTITGLFNQ